MDHFQNKVNLSDWNVRVTLPFLILTFFIDYFYTVQSKSSFRTTGKKPQMLCSSVCLGNSVSTLASKALLSEQLRVPPVPRCSRQEPTQLGKQHSNRANKPNSSVSLAGPHRDRESEISLCTLAEMGSYLLCSSWGAEFVQLLGSSALQTSGSVLWAEVS